MIKESYYYYYYYYYITHIHANAATTAVVTRQSQTTDFVPGFPYATLAQEDRATATSNTHKKSGEDRTCSSRDKPADRQTDRHYHHDTSGSKYWHARR